MFSHIIYLHSRNEEANLWLCLKSPVIYFSPKFPLFIRDTGPLWKQAIKTLTSDPKSLPKWSDSLHLRKWICFDGSPLDYMLFTTPRETEKTMICKQYDPCNHREESAFPIYINTSSRAVWHVDELILPHFRTNQWLFLLIYDSLSPKRIWGSLQNWLIAIRKTDFRAKVGFFLSGRKFHHTKRNSWAMPGVS